MRLRSSFRLAALAVLLAFSAPAARASEGAASYYFPGAFGSFLVAVPPEPGFTAASQTLIFNASANRAVLQGRANVGLNVSALYEYVAGSYAFERTILGGRLQIGAAAPVVGTVNMSASFDPRFFATRSASASDTAFGDIILTPLSLYWNFGDFNVKLGQLVVAPTGHYDINAPINVGRNYWAFDTQLGLTWFHKATGTEVSVLSGLMVNTSNTATDYRTGNEFHLDFMLNKFFAPFFAVGFQGYWYKQIEGDSGQGAVLGSFMGESFGLGPAVLWTPEFLGGKAAIAAKWLFDVSHTNRLQGNWGQITLSYRF